MPLRQQIGLLCVMVALVACFGALMAELPKPKQSRKPAMCVDAYRGSQYIGVYSYPLKDYQANEARHFQLELTEPYECING